MNTFTHTLFCEKRSSVPSKRPAMQRTVLLDRARIADPIRQRPHAFAPGAPALAVTGAP
jgi:hypothetical protein